jgi:uncharacterized lipoprotein YehR (DUF1307 family)
MNNLSSLILLIMCLSISACGNKESKFPIEKRYWTPEDYRNAIWQLSYETPQGEPYPRFSNPETSVIIKKLVDPQNYEVIIDDPELGLNHKNDIAEEFFNHYRDLNKIYRKMDIQDKYIYPQELIEIEKFGLGLEVKYFKLGNDKIAEQSNTPESSKVFVNRNVEVLIQNFTLYLDDINNEKSFGAFAPLLADGINVHFFKLIETYPNGNYSAMLTRANFLLKKTQVTEINQALTNLVNKLESIQKH